MMENNLITFRPMRKEDLDSVLDIDQLSFSMPWPVSAYIHDLNENPAALLWVAEKHSPESGNLVVGMIVIWLVVDEAHIATLAVHPDHRGIGIGSRLLEIGLIEAFSRGAHEAMLEVRASNQAAQSLYYGYGFEIVYRRPRYYRDNNEDALLMNLDNLEDLIAKKKMIPYQMSRPQTKI
jgi:ribosomal-protein-alanine N-acetyltransferase